MSIVNNRMPIRCFCSVLAKRTTDNIFVCGHYNSRLLVCLFHLHIENLDKFYQPYNHSMARDCDMCLATIKIHSKEFIAYCRPPTVRCTCGELANFYQSNKNNANNKMYFFGCGKWRIEDCDYFCWAHKYTTTRDMEIFQRLLPTTIVEQQIQPIKRPREEASDDDDKIPRELQCAVCLTGKKTYMISPCNHLCCCSTCIHRIRNQCPICCRPKESIQRVYLS